MFIEIIKYIVLGLVQGFAEILPISSSGHLALAQSLLQVSLTTDLSALLTIFLHFASLVALIIFFHKLIWQIMHGTFIFIFSRDTNKKQEAKNDFLLFVYLVVASIPVAIVGFLLEDRISSLFGSLLYIGINFVITGFILLFVGQFTRKANNSEYTWKNTLITGLFQCIGVLPGISRSGITMSGGKIAGLNDEKAKQFAFLLFLPVAAGSFIFSLDDLHLITSAGQDLIILFSIATIISFVGTFVALLFIFKKFNLSHYKYFAIYMFFIGTFTIAYYFLTR